MIYNPFVVAYLESLLLRYTLGEWFNVSEQNGRILSLECARHMMSLSDRCLDSYLKLSGRAIGNGRFLFPARPKIHVPWFILKLSYMMFDSYMGFYTDEQPLHKYMDPNP